MAPTRSSIVHLTHKVSSAPIQTVIVDHHCRALPTQILCLLSRSIRSTMSALLTVLSSFGRMDKDFAFSSVKFHHGTSQSYCNDVPGSRIEVLKDCYHLLLRSFVTRMSEHVTHSLAMPILFRYDLLAMYMLISPFCLGITHVKLAPFMKIDLEIQIPTRIRHGIPSWAAILPS